ncbi:energy-coupling factor transporter transmembrane component T family protein [Mycoplasmopsis verecunda]|uniref:Energy-coupling factor transport system permease protein n=1 Tax=Mycoplasmopsis verecunda TaxID=171291 RepID=A0A1T4LIU7_9BACT|nr:energy-coupling factor transporter transmembrane component T [Mycoplasmopsis verecunda]WPB54601.1 energy-coupling factor transporter transmembrane component T [Mycoplasmopsis verecunda]SJZ54344.1 energy-coupling factor transport system permease protein [Mycoplasmopsis verecunda]
MKSVFGRYIPGKGFLYNLDPRIKLLTVILYIVMVFMVSYFIDLIILLIPLVVVYITTNKRVKPLFKLMWLPFFISFIIFFVNIYTITNETVYKDVASMYESKNPLGKTWLVYMYDPKYTFWKWATSSNTFEIKIPMYDSAGKFIGISSELSKLNIQYGISLDSINRTLSLFFRIYIMILTTALLTNTTRPILLTKSIEDILLPLKLIFVPTHVIAMIISIALRFIPTLIDEANRIMKAQSSRGVDFKHGNLKEKINAFSTLIIPLFVSSFARAEDLSNSMETRGYDPYSQRTKYRKIKPTWVDLIVSIFLLSLLAFLIVNMVYPQYLPSWYLVTAVL